MSRKTIHFHHSFLVFAILLTVLIIVVGLIFIGAIGLSFEDVGFSPMTTTLILIATFLGSFVNIPLSRLKTTVPIIKEEFVNFLGVFYRIPQVEYAK